MSTVALSGNDSMTLNGRIFSDFADGDCVLLDFSGEIAAVKTGKNGNSLYSFNASGLQCSLKVRLIRGSSDDKYMNAMLEAQNSNFEGTVLSQGQFVKRIGDGQGNVIKDTYVMSGGVFTKKPQAKNNVEGDTEQSVSVYEMKFSNAPRVIG